MKHSVVMGLLVAFLPCLEARADGVLPELSESRAEVEAGWAEEQGSYVSPVRAFEVEGTRVGALAYVDEPAEVSLEVALVDEQGEVGPWTFVPEASRGDGWRVLVLDLDAPSSRAMVRLHGVERLRDLAWELRVPVGEPRGEQEERRVEPPPVSAALAAIGVVTRGTWGARSTTCTSTEDDWYRMAIHHTAGNQTSSGTVQGAVQALQAYAMDSADYCDIPYQFLVGYDGTLWEGRNLRYYSGATGGDNNDGNIAVCFLGCYTGSGCPGSSHSATDAMMAWARVLIQTLAVEHAFTTTDDVLKGHRDWPGNSTVCPGDYVYERLDELQSSTSYYQGSLQATSWSGTVSVGQGSYTPLSVQLLNVGMNSWEPGVTWLAPTPRDVGSALVASDWGNSGRTATVASTVPPGSVGTFTFSVGSATPGTYTQNFSMVQESVTWFADLPYGGGPSDDGIALTVQVTEATVPDDTGLSGDAGSTDGGGDGGGVGDAGLGDGGEDPLGQGGGPGTLAALPDGQGCAGCASGRAPSRGLMLIGMLGPLMLIRRRSRQPTG